MEDKDIINCLFERKQDIAHFRSSDEILKNYSKATSKADGNLTNFIANNIHPSLKNQLEKLIEEKDIAYYDYFYRENFLYYSSGFSDAINLIFSNVIPNNNDCSI